MPTPADVLRFWFGTADPTQAPTVPASRWWTSDPDFDAEIQQRFGDLMGRALSGGLSHWAESPEGTLALIIVLDQFPRNVYRGTGSAFAGDAQAIVHARALDGGPASWHHQVRTFALLPFEHSESLADQQHSVAAFTALVEAVPAASRLLDFAIQHHDIVARFGRFPHRNRALGRRPTDEERAFLADGGPSFGQS